MEQLKLIKAMLTGAVEDELKKGLENVELCEVAETIDMIKDLAEAMYYCKKVEIMEKEHEEHEKTM